MESVDDALTAAIEGNLAEFLLAMGRAGGGVERDDARIGWTVGGSPIDYHNAVVRAHLAPADADDEIRAWQAELRRRGLPGSWHLGPSSRPADLGERLVRLGFAHADDEIGMGADLDAVPDRVPVPAGLAIERVRDEPALAAWTGTLARGFGEGEREAAWVGSVYAAIGLGDVVPWRHFLARLDGRPVATSSLFLRAGVGGVYFVFTVPEARRRGIGAAVTLAALHEARTLGCRLAVLGSSAMGRSVYRRLGFDERCRIGVYEWRP
jgi:GNAT superfamily N-acetyltransferase